MDPSQVAQEGWEKMNKALNYRFQAPHTPRRKGFLYWTDRLDLTFRHYRWTWRYNRRWVKNLIVTGVALGLSVPRPPPIKGIPQSGAFLFLLVSFLLAPSFPFASLCAMLVFSIVALAFAGLLQTALFASIIAYNTAYPGGQLWRLIYLVFEIVVAWLFFLPVATTGLVGLNFAANSAGIFMLTVEAVKTFPELKPGFNIWYPFTELLPMGFIMILVTFFASLLVGGPESSIERLRDAQVDLLYSLKRMLIAQTAAETNEPCTAEVLSKFGPIDEKLAKKRGYLPAGQLFDPTTFTRLQDIIYFEVQEILRQRRASNLEVFVISRDDPNLMKELSDAVMATMESAKALSASAKFSLGLRQSMGMPTIGHDQNTEPLTENDKMDAQALWKFIAVALDSMNRLIQVLDPDSKPALDGGVCSSQLEASLNELSSYILHGPFAISSRELDSTDDVVLTSARQLMFVDMFTFGQQLLKALKISDEALEVRSKTGRFGTFFKSRKIRDVIADPAPFTNTSDVNVNTGFIDEKVVDTRDLSVAPHEYDLEKNPVMTGNGLDGTYHTTHARSHLDPSVGKKSLMHWFLGFWSSDSVVLSNQVATATFLVLVWAVVPFSEDSFMYYHGWWIMYPIYFTLCADSLGGSIYRGFWRWIATVLACIIAILCTLPDYGTNSIAVGILGFVWLGLLGWITAYAPEFLDVASVGGFCWVYVVWASYGKPPDPNFQPGVSAGIRLLMVTIGILIGLLLYLIGRPKYSRTRVRLRVAKMLMDIEAIVEVMTLYANRPEMFKEELKTDKLRNVLHEANLDMETTRREMDLAGGEPNAVYPWSDKLYTDMVDNLSDLLARLTSVSNFYRWLSTNYNTTELLANATSTIFGQGRLERAIIWSRELAICLYGEQNVIPMSDLMKNVIMAVVKDSTVFRNELRDYIDGKRQDLSPGAKAVVQMVPADQLPIRVSLSTIVAITGAVVATYLSEIERDIIGLYGVREVGSPIKIPVP